MTDFVVKKKKKKKVKNPRAFFLSKQTSTTAELL